MMMKKIRSEILLVFPLKEQLSYFAKKKIFNVKEAVPQDLLAFFYFMNLTGLGSWLSVLNSFANGFVFCENIEL